MQKRSKLQEVLDLEKNSQFKRIKKLFRWDYPKLTLLIMAVVLAYFLFNNPKVQNWITTLDNLSYLGIFIAGLFFTIGFTTPFSVGYFIVANPGNIWLAGILGGIGAMMGDLLIFSVIRFSFMDEFKKLSKTKIIKNFSVLIDTFLKQKIKIYLTYIFAGIIIASPAPDEIGVIMLAGLTKIKPLTLAIISLIMNTVGILILLLI